MQTVQNKSLYGYTVKPVLSSHSKRRLKIGFQDLLSLNACQKYSKILQEEHFAILLTLITLPFVIKFFVLFCLFVSVRFRFYCILFARAFSLGFLYQNIYSLGCSPEIEYLLCQSRELPGHHSAMNLGWISSFNKILHGKVYVLCSRK